MGRADGASVRRDGLIFFVRWLAIFCFCLGAAQAADQSGAADVASSSLQKIQSAAGTLNEVQQAMDDADSVETLKSLADKALGAQRDADTAVSALAPVLSQIEARADQLGPIDKGEVEGADIAAQRKALERERSDVDSAIKRGKLLSVEASQLAAALEKLRSQQFNAQILRKAASPLTPAFWQQVAKYVPGDLNRMQALMRQGRDAFARAMAGDGRSNILLCGALALLLLFPVRMGLRHLGRRYAASAHAPEGRLRRSGLAVWLLLVGTSMPTLACWVWVEGLRAVDAIPPRLQLVADQSVVALGVGAFVAALSTCLLVPTRPSWRLLNMDDLAATRLRKYAWGAAVVVAFSIVVRTVNGAARTSEMSSVALDGFVALTYMGLIGAALLTLSRLRKRQQGEAGQGEAAARPASHGYNGWLMLAWLGGHVAVLAALVAALFGYLNLSLFAASQMVWMTVVVMATTLLMKFADDLCNWLLSPNSRSGRALMQVIAAGPARVEQAGVLLSAVLRVCVLMMGVGAVLAPFGNASALFGWVNTLANGVTIGGAVLRPGAVLWAALALCVGLAVFKAFQSWLVDTYLPKTELDLGARNSISTVSRYLGLTLVVVWALAALGIGFEKLALVASALSVGIGFGLQAITQNFVSGLILLAERPVKLGDRVRIGDQEGDIRRINVRATEIQVDDKSTLIVPNSELITKTVRNMTMGSPLGRIQIKFTVPVSTDVVMLKALLLTVYNAHDGVLDAPAPSVYIDGISDGVITVNSFAHVGSPRNVYSVRSDLLFAVLPALAQADMPLVTPSDIHVIRDPEPDPATLRVPPA